MKGCLLLLIVVASVGISVCSADDPQVESVRALISRVLPATLKDAVVVSRISAAAADLDVFEIESVNATGDQIAIRGNTGVAMATGLNYYLKYYCHAVVSWGGDQLDIHRPLPRVEKVVRIVMPNKYRYYMNVCTVSYSAAWWDFSRWEREIDWMALNGINLPLAFTGQEYIWEAVFESLNVTLSSLQTDFFGGPAFLAWQRMANIRAWGGPLPKSFIDQQYSLQLRILERMQSLGMFPVLRAFDGNVPKALKTLYPSADIIRTPNWGHFPDESCCAYFLQPTDPLFSTIGKLFIQKQRELFGPKLETHIYNGDMFNEMLPPSKEPSYLRSISKNLFDAIRSADSQGVWLMQGWLFENDPQFWTLDSIEAYLSGVPNDGMLVLDLWSEANPIWKKTKSYFGKPYIWCMLHSFGGSPGLFGDLVSVNSGPSAARLNGSSIVGVGLTMEAIEHNYIVYDLMTEMGWRSAPAASLDQWVDDFTVRRYGADVSDAKKAWRFLENSVYRLPFLYPHSRMIRTPSLKMTIAPFLPPIARGFDEDGSRLVSLRGAVATALGLLLNSRDKLKNVALYQYDLVEIMRQVLSDLFRETHDAFVSAYSEKSLPKAKVAGSRLLELLSDVDSLLSSNSRFLFGRWVSDAIRWGKTQSEKDLLEFNARNQVTLWGPTGNINDYAAKLWGSLVKTYYYHRWEMFVTAVEAALEAGKAFDENAFDADLLKWEEQWQVTHTSHPVDPVGDTVKIATDLWTKYHPTV